MKTKKHLFKGSIYQENGMFVARDSKESYMDYGKTKDDCKRSIFSKLSLMFPHTPFAVEFYEKATCCNFSAYKRGKRTQ